jgi:hypothetical protein
MKHLIQVTPIKHLIKAESIDHLVKATPNPCRTPGVSVYEAQQVSVIN